METLWSHLKVRFQEKLCLRNFMSEYHRTGHAANSQVSEKV